jgi:hypothetical protein
MWHPETADETPSSKINSNPQFPNQASPQILEYSSPDPGGFRTQKGFRPGCTKWPIINNNISIVLRCSFCDPSRCVPPFFCQCLQASLKGERQQTAVCSLGAYNFIMAWPTLRSALRALIPDGGYESLEYVSNLCLNIYYKFAKKKTMRDISVQTTTGKAQNVALLLTLAG